MNQSPDEIKAQIAARTADLTNLRARNVSALDPATKREHRLNQMDCEEDIADLGRALMLAEVEQRSAANVEQRAAGRAQKAEIAELTCEAIALTSQWAEKAREIIAIGEQQKAVYSLIQSKAAQVQAKDPAYRNSLTNYEEAEGILSLARGNAASIACATARQVRDIIDSLPCGEVVKGRYLVPEYMAVWGESDVEAAAVRTLDALAGRLASKCEEPDQDREAA